MQLTMTNTPEVTDLYDIMRKFHNAFRSFQLPKSLSSEDGEYVHEQEKFDSSNLVIVGHPDLEVVFDQLFNQTWAPQKAGTSGVASTNMWMGKGKFIPSNFMAV